MKRRRSFVWNFKIDNLSFNNFLNKSHRLFIDLQNAEEDWQWAQARIECVTFYLLLLLPILLMNDTKS